MSAFKIGTAIFALWAVLMLAGTTQAHNSRFLLQSTCFNCHYPDISSARVFALRVARSQSGFRVHAYSAANVRCNASLFLSFRLSVVWSNTHVCLPLQGYVIDVFHHQIVLRKRREQRRLLFWPAAKQAHERLTSSFLYLQIICMTLMCRFQGSSGPAAVQHG